MLPPEINPDSFDRAVIRREVHEYERSILPSPKYWGRSRKLVHFQLVISAYGVFFGRWVLRTLNETVNGLFTNSSM